MKFPTSIRKALPYVVAVALFWVVSALYFAPQFSGDTIAMNDVVQYGGMKQDISEHRATYGEDPQWTGGMFSGMPAYLITVRYPAMILRNAVQWGMNLMGEPAALMFLAMLGFWLMLLMCGVNPWLAIPFSLAYAFSTYNILIIEAGHITKMRAMGYAPMLVGAVLYTFRRPRAPSSATRLHNIWLGGALSALFGSLLIAASHHQITYYFLLVVVAFWINELVSTARDRTREGWRRFTIATAVLVGAGVLAIGANFTHIWYTLEHSPETTRGGSELVADVADGGAGTAGDASDAGSTGGLDIDYATAWSYGTGESLNMFIPNFKGGSSWGGFSIDGPVADVLRRSGISPSMATQLSGYWGDQPGTGGPTYLGAVMVFLFVLGMFVLPARQKWWILGVSVFALMLAWGRNAMWFTELNFALLPGYNKFRTVAMALAVLQWSAPFVAALVAAGLWRSSFGTSTPTTSKISAAANSTPASSSATPDTPDRPTTPPYTPAFTDKARFMRDLWWSLGITGGLALLFALFSGSIFNFAAASDSYYEGVPGLIDAVRSERAAMLRADSWRSLYFVILTAGVVWLWVSRQSIKRWIPVAALSALVLADLVPVDMRFLSHDDFHAPSQIEVTPDEADLDIMADPEPAFRVLNTQNPFNEAYTSYFHRSVGGYHAAKLSRYQDLIDRYLVRFHPGVLGMLNTKYFIINDPASGARSAELNGEALGAAWFVDNVEWVDGAVAELEALDKTDLRHTAVVDRRFEDKITRFSSQNEHPSTLKVIEYRPNYVKYEASSTTEQLAVFSEIYYDKGWKAYIDGIETPYLRADYILRAMMIPSGDHTIEWRFRAPRFALVEGITLAASIVILLWLVTAIIFKQKARNN